MEYNIEPNNRYLGIYKAKLRTPDEIAEYIEDDFVCACPTCMAEPKAIVHAIGERRDNKCSAPQCTFTRRRGLS